MPHFEAEAEFITAYDAFLAGVSPSAPAVHRVSLCPDLVWSKDGADWPNRDFSRFVEAAGITLACARGWAKEPPLLLIHGTGAATHSWRRLLPLLAENFSV